MTTPFRKKLRAAVLFVIMGGGIFAIVVTGFGTGGSGAGGMGGSQQSSSTLIRVGGESLTDTEINNRMGMLFRQAAANNPNLDRAAFFRENFDAILDGMVDRMTLVAFARQQGFVVPQTLIDRQIVSDPTFHNVTGQFDDQRFRDVLQQSNMTEQQLRRDIEAQLLVRMIAAPLGGTPRVPQQVSREFANLLLETRTGQFGAVPTALLARSINPSDQEVTDYYQRNTAQFQLPERRVVRYALIGRDQLGDAARASDAEIAAYYQEHQAQYGPSETRSLQIFTTQDEAAANRLAGRVRGGTSFVEAARAEGFAAEDVTFANQRREQVVQQTSAEVAEAAFAAAQGGLVGPTRTPSGFKVVRVESIARAEGRPLEAVRAEIVAAVEQRKLADAINTRAEEIEDRVSDGASVEDIARQYNLRVETTPALTNAGVAPNFRLPNELAPVARAAFETEPGDPVIEVIQPDAQVALVEVVNILPPAAPPLDQIRDEVRTRLIQQTALERGRQMAEAIVNRINGGMAPAQAYAQAGTPLPSPESATARRFQIARAGQRVPPPLTILFAIPEGRARMIKAPNDQGWIIIHHQRRVAGNAETDPQARESVTETERELSQVSAPEIQAQFARAVRAAMGIERNEDAINALRERLVRGQ